MNKVLNLSFASSLTKLCEINSSFDTGILRVCYTGDNRNCSNISKKSIEKSLPTIYNCPIVCNYDRETGTFGGHDIGVVKDENGDKRVINKTQPVGVIPESARVWFEDFEEDDGTIHEYLCVEVLLWKRQEAYRKIKENGTTGHSMEITVKEGNIKDDILYIDSFEFTAFALIGVEPCFEGSALEVYSKQEFKQQLFEMMQELKESLNQIATSIEDNNTHPQHHFTEGGTGVLENKLKILAELGIDADTLDFSLEDISEEELINKFKNDGEMPASEPDSSEEPEGEAEKGTGFALTQNTLEELYRVLETEKITREWGETSRYLYADSDFDLKEVYCWDVADWLLYGFEYNVDGDNVTINFDSKKRKKYTITDFEEGDKTPLISEVFGAFERKLNECLEFESKYSEASERVNKLEAEINELREYKANIEISKKKEILCDFAELSGIEEFDALNDKIDEYTEDSLREKCYAIKGKNIDSAKFGLVRDIPKLKIDKADISDGEISEEPYGGILKLYNIGQN